MAKILTIIKNKIPRDILEKELQELRNRISRNNYHSHAFRTTNKEAESKSCKT